MDMSLIPQSATVQVEKALEFARTVAIVEINTAKEAENANYLFLLLSNHIKDLEAERKRIKDEFLQKGREVDNYFNPPKTNLNNLKTALNGALLLFKRKIDAQREAEQTRLNLIAAEAQRKLDEAAQIERDKADALRKQADEAETAEEAVRLRAQAGKADLRADVKDAKAEAIIAPIAQVVRPRLQGTTVRANWKAEIDDAELFVKWAVDNAQYMLLIPNDKALQAWAKTVKTEKSFPGGRIYNDEKLGGIHQNY
jgi:hypothetical protein